MQKSVENLCRVVIEARVTLKDSASFDDMYEWDAKIKAVCPNPTDLEGDDWQDVSDMLFEWDCLCIGIRRRAFEAEEKRVGP